MNAAVFAVDVGLNKIRSKKYCKFNCSKKMFEIGVALIISNAEVSYILNELEKCFE